MDKTQKLLAKARAGLSNPDEVKELDINSAIQESDSIVGDKQISDALYLDIAYYRFLGIIGSNPGDRDESLYKIAFRELGKSMSIKEDKKHTAIKVKQRKTQW